MKNGKRNLMMLYQIITSFFKKYLVFLVLIINELYSFENCYLIHKKYLLILIVSYILLSFGLIMLLHNKKLNCTIYVYIIVKCKYHIVFIQHKRLMPKHENEAFTHMLLSICLTIK